jgi:hypothetical protein
MKADAADKRELTTQIIIKTRKLGCPLSRMLAQKYSFSSIHAIFKVESAMKPQNYSQYLTLFI